MPQGFCRILTLLSLLFLSATGTRAESLTTVKTRAEAGAEAAC
jgi:hypothetical protein